MSNGSQSTEPRKLPTRPGCWWGREFLGTWKGSGELLVYNIVARADDGALMVSIPPHLDNPACYEWLAPIPGPAVLAALAECEAAEMAWANGDLDDELLERAVTNAEARLYAAMRAERDGAA